MSSQAVKCNEEACLQLAERATEIVYAITIATAGRKDTITEDLDNGLQKLIGYVKCSFVLLPQYLVLKSRFKYS